MVGFDLVGPEDNTKPIVDYLVPLLRFKDRQKELGVDIPFIFHAGETLGDGTAADDNLYDAILLGTKRIGHGSEFSLSLSSLWCSVQWSDFSSSSSMIGVVKVFDNQAPEADGDMQGTQDRFGSLPDFVRPLFLSFRSRGGFGLPVHLFIEMRFSCVESSPAEVPIRSTLAFSSVILLRYLCTRSRRC